MMPTPPQRARSWTLRDVETTTPAKTSCSSTESFRFTFNELDFRERCEQAALRLGFIGDRLDEPELEDLVNLAVNGEILDPASALGDHVNDCWPAIVGPAERSLVHWLRRLVSAAPGSTSASARASSTSPYDGHPLVLLRAAGPRPRADRARPRALLGPGRLPQAARPVRTFRARQRTAGVWCGWVRAAEVR